MTPCPRALRLQSILRALLLTAGRGAVARSVPALFAVLLVYGVFFGPNGLSARDVVPHLLALPAARLFAGTVWLALLVPAARALFDPDAARMLRVLPIEPAAVAAVHLSLLAVLQLPATVFLWRSGLPWLALSASAWSLAALSALSLARAGWARAGPPLAALSLVLWLAPTPLWLAVSGCALAPVLALRAFSLAPEAPARPPSRALPRYPGLALALVHLRVFARSEPLRLALFAAVVLACSTLTWLAVRNNGLHALSPCLTVALGLGAPATVLAGGLGAGTVLRSEGALAMLLRGVPREQALVPRAARLATLAFTLPAGVALGLGAGLSLAPRALFVSVVAMAATSIAQGLLCDALARRSGDASTVSGGLLALAVAQLVLALTVGARGVLLWVFAAALVVVAGAARRASVAS